MKNIKIAVVNFWQGFDIEQTSLYQILSKRFHIILDNRHPDYVLASCFGDIGSVLKYQCPRIQLLFEPMSPDFTLFDYAIGNDFITCLDKMGNNRFFRFPTAFIEGPQAFKAKAIEKKLTFTEANAILRTKTRFCTFVSGHQTECGERERVLFALSKYKKIDSAGKHLNNMLRAFTVKREMTIRDIQKPPSCFFKLPFLREGKFSIAGESMRFPGFVTEKILDCFYSRTIPIYIGDPFIAETFNPKAFIDASMYKTEKDLIEKIRELDSNDALYLDMLTAPAYPPGKTFSDVLKGYQEFLFMIFDQSPDEAIRRPLYYTARYYEMALVQKNQPVRKKVSIETVKERLSRHFRRKHGDDIE